jgi:hypothetical protein
MICMKIMNNQKKFYYLVSLTNITFVRVYYIFTVIAGGTLNNNLTIELTANVSQLRQQSSTC